MRLMRFDDRHSGNASCVLDQTGVAHDVSSLAWIIQEYAKFSLVPCTCRKFHSLGNTVCIPLPHEIPYRYRVLRDNQTFHE